MTGAYRILCALMMLLLGGCLGMPKNVVPVQGFEINRYLGKWYEIARLDHSFERGLDQVTAEYSLLDSGGVQVINRGFSSKSGEWSEARGKALFANNTDEGYLKVSFFGPFYGSYIIFELDEQEYQYAFISGPDTSYLWFLSRTPQVDEVLTQRFLEQAARLGFDTEKLIFPRQVP